MSEVKTPLLDAVKAVTEKQIKATVARIEKGFDERAAFEALNAPANSSIQDKLKGYRKKLAAPGFAALSHAAAIDPNFMNTSPSGGAKRFNVYAIDKVADLAQALTSGSIRNAVNKAIVASMLRCAEAGVPFTMVAAQAAASANLKVDKALGSVLVRHTVSPSTAPTQASSTMAALQVMGAVRNTGTPKHPVYELTDSAVADRLREVA